MHRDYSLFRWKHYFRLLRITSMDVGHTRCSLPATHKMKIKKYEIMGYGRLKNPRVKKLKILLEVQQREENAAIRQGKTYAKMMGYEFSHVVEKGKI